MAESSSASGSRGFFSYYRAYAKTGVHAASAAALTAFGLFASFTGNRWFILIAIAVYVLPLVFLYLSGEGENVPSVVGTDTDSAATRDADIDSSTAGASPEADADSVPEITESKARTTDASDDDDTAVADEPDSGVAGREPAADTDATETVDSGAESVVSDVSIDEPDTAGVEPGWKEIDVPTDQSLLDVVSVDGGAFAVGESGVVLARDDDGWGVALEDGPTAESNPLRGVDATADGGAVWFAGDSGVLGRYTDGRLTDHSAPNDQTSAWTDVAVTEKAGDERIHLVNGSGELLRGEYDGGSVEWDEIEKPGSGSSIAAIEFADDDRGHLVDTNQSVYEITNGGESYEQIGIEDANAAFADVAATDSTVVVAGDDSSVFRYDGAVWTRLRPSESALSAVDLVDGVGLAAGDAGAVFELADGDWEPVETPVEADLAAITVGASEPNRPAIAVGTDGMIIERQR